MTGILGLVIYLCLIAIVVWLVFFILGNIPMPPPVRTVITVVFAILLLIWLFNHFGGMRLPS